MIIGVPRENKPHEYRVGLTPASVRELIHHDHRVTIETHAGEGIGFTDQDYRDVGAEIMPNAALVFESADLIVKVKEPQLDECAMLRADQVLFTYLHLAAAPELVHKLQESACVAIAYETVSDPTNGLPLLSPMSEVAGRLSIQAGAHCLEKSQGGNGILLSGVPGVEPGNVLVLGGGVVGTSAVRMAIGKEAHVTVLDRSLKRLQALDLQFGAKLNTIFSTVEAIEHYVQSADLVVGAVLIPGAASPKLVTREMIRKMRPGSALVDVSIDQGGCFETSRPTTHSHPTYVEEGVIHYCVTNMPGAVARTSTFALNNATLPFILALANKGYPQALRDDPHLMQGLNIFKGQITHEAVADSLDEPYTHPLSLLN